MKQVQRIIIVLNACIFFMQLNTSAQQQIENTMSRYFRNRMLPNPALTGADGDKIYALHNRSWMGFDGAPVLTNISGEFSFGTNSSLGAQFTSDLSGVLRRSIGAINYAYNVKLSETQNIRTGISLTFTGESLNGKYRTQGGGTDPLLVGSVNNKLQFDGNLGAVYTNRNFSLGVAFLRLNQNFFNEKEGGADLAHTQLSAGYDITVDGDERLSLKPLAMIRFFKATDAVVDFGAQFEYNKTANVMLMYQSGGNLKMGLGIKMSKLGEANFFYNTNTEVPGAAAQQYELGIGFYLGRDKGNK